MELKDYLHLYIGCEVEYGYEGTKKIGRLIGKDDHAGWQVFTPIVRLPYLYVRDELIKPILRSISDMTDADKLLYYDEFLKDDSDTKCRYSHDHKCNYANLHLKDYKFEPKTFVWLLKQGFDLFGLIEADLAVNKTKI